MELANPLINIVLPTFASIILAWIGNSCKKPIESEYNTIVKSWNADDKFPWGKTPEKVVVKGRFDTSVTGERYQQGWQRQETQQAE